MGNIFLQLFAILTLLHLKLIETHRCACYLHFCDQLVSQQNTMLQVEATCVVQSKLKLYFLQQILVLLLDILHHWSYNLPHNKFEFQPLWLAVISVAMREIERTNMVEGEEEPELAVDQKLSETQICPLQRPQAKGYHDSVHDTFK